MTPKVLNLFTVEPIAEEPPPPVEIDIPVPNLNGVTPDLPLGEIIHVEDRIFIEDSPGHIIDVKVDAQ